jgi:uncharacterized protein
VSTSLLLTYIVAGLLVQLAVGSALTLRRRRLAARLPGRGAELPQLRVSSAWDGWREFRVVRREFEDLAQTQCSFYLSPVDGNSLPPFEPGQFLTIALELPDATTGGKRRLTRCYSLSDRPDASRYRITVKRVGAPAGRPALAPGVCSNHLHDWLQQGDTIEVKAPAGRFVLDPEPTISTVLIAGGIGITPLLSMLRAGLATHASRTIHLYYGVRRGGEHAFRQELAQLARLHPSFHANVVYSQPGAEDVRGRDYQYSGHLSVDLLRRTLPSGRHRFYVCGPAPMMATLVPELRQWGVPPDDIRHEAFGPASARAAQSTPPAIGARAARALEIRFGRSARSLVWDGTDANLLDFAERNDVSVPSGCRAGSCGSCETRVLSGTVRHAPRPEHEIAPGHCLLCLGIPETSLELEA